MTLVRGNTAAIEAHEIKSTDSPTTRRYKTEFPLVSCVMPTANRPEFLEQSLYYFHLQNYPNKELIIVYNSETDLPKTWRQISIHNFPQNIKFVKTNKAVLGAKRNEGCLYASGEIIAQWDDDDIYGTTRLMEQTRAIIDGRADITGLDNFVFYETETGLSYKATHDLFKVIFRGCVACGTLVFDRYLWDKMAHYQNVISAEDYYFQADVLSKGARLKVIDGYHLFSYLRHQTNTWRFETDNFRRYAGWLPAELPRWISKYIEFYKLLSIRRKTPSATNKNQLIFIS